MGGSVHYEPRRPKARGVSKQERGPQMKRTFISLMVALSCVGCTSIESTAVDKDEVQASGEPVGVIQANSVGFTLLFHAVEAVDSDLDQVVNKLLISEAKAMGASKVELKSASTTPRHGIYRVFTATGPLLNLFSFTHSSGSAVAVK